MPKPVLWAIPGPDGDFERVTDLADDADDFESLIAEAHAAHKPAIAAALERARDEGSGEVEAIVARNRGNARFRPEQAEAQNVEPVPEVDAPEGADVDDRTEIARLLQVHRPPATSDAETTT